jgi:hypothetical protein
VPNQEKVTIRAISVTYHDRATNVLMILLPNRELMQAESVLSADNSFHEWTKQDWELRMIQSGTGSTSFCLWLFALARSNPGSLYTAEKPAKTPILWLHVFLIDVKTAQAGVPVLLPSLLAAPVTLPLLGDARAARGNSGQFHAVKSIGCRDRQQFSRLV